ncbi:NlpC/P60 family protein [Tardiphaga sp.]|uniref:NlpC/P60 family protein n=1 Tax=Tardiphaga sp. TaxID=1926292 RepID=UPI0026095381|nr:NlpC/P60 family protein [Tardiphaga sp.]MDB5620505.1 putative tail assembly protein [Tardiphaga sp.]
MHWSSAYVGMPWKDMGRERDGVDCWGLFRLPYIDLHGIELPAYADGWTSSADRAEVAAILANDSRQWPWVPVMVGDAREFDMAVFRRGGMETHVGLVIGAGAVLHAVAGHSSYVERFDRGPWKHRLAGIYRHIELVKTNAA